MTKQPDVPRLTATFKEYSSAPDNILQQKKRGQSTEQKKPRPESSGEGRSKTHLSKKNTL
jgi:hypothetical protein